MAAFRALYLRRVLFLRPICESVSGLSLPNTPTHTSSNTYNSLSSPSETLSLSYQHLQRRLKYKKSSKTTREEAEEESDESDSEDEKLFAGVVPSLRVDAVLKAALGLSRNKVEQYFYENKIRINGAKLDKKSHKINIGDELDLIKNENPSNPSLLFVSRVVLVSARETDEGDKLKIKLKRFKNLSIEDYEDPWLK